MDTIGQPCDNKSEVTALKGVIRSLCDITNPLGKAIDFLKEDAETMAKEQQFWMKDQELHHNQLQEEKSISKESLEKDLGQLTALEEELKYHHRRISSLKGEILQNDEMIMKLLRLQTSVNYNSLQQ